MNKNVETIKFKKKKKPFFLNSIHFDVSFEMSVIWKNTIIIVNNFKMAFPRKLKN